jgi:hypothetical protein
MDLNIEPSHLSFFERNVAQKRWHYVHFHESDGELVDNICRFLQPALRPKHAGVVVATQEHLAALRERAPAFGLDLPAAEATGQFVPVDAAELLSRIMLDGMPDHTRFHVIVQGLLKDVASKHPYMHIYGEMVALLWQQGNEQGTLLLEELWNNLGRMRPFSLLCGYPKNAFRTEEDANNFSRICNAHSHMSAA